MQVSALVVLCSLGPFFLSSCSSREDDFKGQVVKSMSNNPEILAQAMKSNSQQFAGAFHSALEKARNERMNILEKRRQQNTKEAMRLKHNPNLQENDLYRGRADAPLILFLYGNFEGRVAKKAFETARSLLDEYQGKIKFIYKHLPMEMHANAMISAKYYEALRLQNGQLALDFQEQLFNNQEKLRRGETYLKELALDLGANESRLTSDLKTHVIERRIEQDIKEAQKFGLNFGPSFILNGIPITGAFPQERFKDLISKLETKHFVSN